MYNVTVLAVFANSGVYNYGYWTELMVQHWAQHLQIQADRNPAWPFRVQVEYVDYRSNLTYLNVTLTQRLAQLPKVGAILAPEGQIGFQFAPLAGSWGIPYLLTSSNPDPLRARLPDNQPTAFYIEAPAMYTFGALIDAYVEKGVRTVATVAYSDDADAGYNHWSCYGAATYIAVPRGIRYLAEYNLYANSTAADVHRITLALKRLDPDVVLWCDWQSCTFNDTHSSTRFGMRALKNINYLPKSVTLLDCYYTPVTNNFVTEGLMDYVVQPTFTHPHLVGQAYTEDDLPYATAFRPTRPVQTVQDNINVGAGPDSPSSVHLFTSWFVNATGGLLPPYQSNGFWAALDLLEGAIYRVTQNAHMVRDGTVDPQDIVAMLVGAQASGPYGRVVFDAHRINTPTPTIAVQLMGGALTPSIVAPSSQQEFSMVYPIPTWSERIYTWRLDKGAGFVPAVAVAAVCSALLVAMAITVVWKRGENDVRILQYTHMLQMVGSALVAIWCGVLMWQADMTARQCTGYAWGVYLPMSLTVNIVAMKAYRLSVFLQSESRHRLKRLTHTRMLLLAYAWTAGSAVVLAVAQGVDPPTLLTVVMDPFRPSLDVHTCVRKNPSTTLLYMFVLSHLVGTTGCVISVRNGTGEFRDGTVMKEAFLAFWGCVIIAVIMQTFALDPFQLYTLRSVFISLGVTTFCFRILINRCYRHWMPKIVELMVMRAYAKVVQMLPGHDSRRKSSSLISFDAEDMPMYAEETPDGQNLDEMHDALRDPGRSASFRTFADKALVVENVDFLLSLEAFERECEEELMESSKGASERMKVRADERFRQFIQVGSPQEVNISSQTRGIIETKMREWTGEQAIITVDAAQTALADDPLHHIDLFDRANKEISIMLYQNLWNKFRAQELEELMK